MTTRKQHEKATEEDLEQLAEQFVGYHRQTNIKGLEPMPRDDGKVPITAKQSLLRPGQVIRLWNGSHWLVEMVNNCRARISPLGRRTKTVATREGMTAEFETPDGTTTNVSPMLDCEILSAEAAAQLLAQRKVIMTEKGEVKRGPAEPAQERFYEIADKKEAAKLKLKKGQQQVIIQALMELKCASLLQLVELVEGKIEGRQPAARVVNYYLYTWTRAGLTRLAAPPEKPVSKPPTRGKPQAKGRQRKR